LELAVRAPGGRIRPARGRRVGRLGEVPARPCSKSCRTPRTAPRSGELPACLGWKHRRVKVLTRRTKRRSRPATRLTASQTTRPLPREPAAELCSFGGKISGSAARITRRSASVLRATYSIAGPWRRHRKQNRLSHARPQPQRLERRLWEGGTTS